MWYFLSPKIVFGEDALQELSQIAGERAFIVTDETMKELGFLSMVEALVESAGLDHKAFTKIEPDPSIQTTERCAAEMLQYNPDWIIGLGGGSCLDAAKGAWFRYERPDVPLDAINPFENFQLRRKARFAAISTTSGTGADVSWGFALKDTDAKAKLVRVSHELIPDLAIVDPVFVMQLPGQITADVGMDILAHAIEAYTNTWHNDFTDPLALKAIELVFRCLPIAYRDGSNKRAREHLHNAATIAGLAFSNTAIIIAHALAHAIGAAFHTHHGRTVGMLLPYTIQYNGKESPDRYLDILRYIPLIGKDQETTISTLVSQIRKLAVEIDQPLTIADLGISRESFEKALPVLINNTGNALELLANPRQPSGSDIENIFRYAFTGKDIDF